MKKYRWILFGALIIGLVRAVSFNFIESGKDCIGLENIPGGLEGRQVAAYCKCQRGTDEYGFDGASDMFMRSRQGKVSEQEKKEYIERMNMSCEERARLAPKNWF